MRSVGCLLLCSVWEPVEGAAYSRMVWEPESVPVVTSTLLIVFSAGPADTSRTTAYPQVTSNPIHEVVVFGRSVEHNGF